MISDCGNRIEFDASMTTIRLVAYDVLCTSLNPIFTTTTTIRCVIQHESMGFASGAIIVVLNHYLVRPRVKLFGLIYRRFHSFHLGSFEALSGAVPSISAYLKLCHNLIKVCEELVELLLGPPITDPPMFGSQISETLAPLSCLSILHDGSFP